MTASPTGMPPLPPPLARVYDRAQADATRSGHGEVTPAHLTLALAMSHPELVDQVLGRATVAAATLALSMAARSFAEPAPNEPCRQALRSAAGSSDPLGALAALLRAAAPAATPAGPATGAARFELTALRAGYAEVVSAPAWLIARPDLVEPTIAALAAGRSPLVVAAEGSGRSTTAALLAARLHVPGYGGPLAGRAVVRVRTADIVAVETGPALHALLQEVAGRAVVVLDDLEVLSGLGGGSRLDAGLLAVVRGAAHDSAHLLVLLLARPYDQALAGQEPELVEECVLVEPAGLDP
ncbi:MAG TPA: hypothetical protein VFN19_02645, partial [Candidatus Nanopelagicales bacterium]|nr:hypothetical protein [Candidatus Nanopelagicales bacterium]